MNRTEVGWREFGRATGGRGPVATEKAREASPVLADGVGEFIFADVFSRSGLSARERELVTVAVLMAIGGAEPQLGLHVPAALECGVDGDELVALAEQITPYAGFPRGLNGLRAVRGVLEERGLPLPLPAERVDLGDHETLVADTGGEGRPIVLIHPLGLDRLAWRDLARALAPSRRVIAYDLRGHGGAGGAPRADADGLVADLAALLAARGVEGVDLAGAGSGALLAARAARALGDRVGALTLVGPVPAAGGLAAWVTPESLAADAWPIRYLRDRERRAHREAWAHLEQELTAAPLSAAVPTAVVVGTRDPGAGAAAAQARDIGATVHEIEAAGHLVAVERPSDVARLLA
ncbi:MAG: alpha/beta fold hydrolase [Thermoleophilia bacterium]